MRGGQNGQFSVQLSSRVRASASVWVPVRVLLWSGLVVAGAGAVPGAPPLPGAGTGTGGAGTSSPQQICLPVTMTDPSGPTRTSSIETGMQNPITTKPPLRARIGAG